MAKMKMSQAERPRGKLECLRMLATLKLDPARSRLIGVFVDSYLNLNAKDLRANAPSPSHIRVLHPNAG